MSAPRTVCSRCPNLTPCPRHAEYVIVTGPPCAGKSTYILRTMATGDLVVDFDRLAQAISPKSSSYSYPEHVRDAVRAMRLAVIEHVRAHTAPDAKLWVIDTAIDDHDAAMSRYRRDGARVVELDPGIAVCLARAAKERPPDVVTLIHRWYEMRSAECGP